MLLQQRDSKPRPEGKNRAGDAILAAGKSCQAGLSGAERKQADADDRFRIPPSPPRKRDRICGLFFVLHKRRRDEKGTARLWREKNHPVNGFLVPRAGGGTAPVPPGESLLLRQLHAQHNVLCTRCFWGSFYNRYHQLTRAHKPERLVLVRSCVLVACITSSSTALLGLGSPSKQAL